MCQRVIPDFDKSKKSSNLSWDSASSIYPDDISIYMADGRKIKYRRVVALPRPQLFSGLTLYQPKHAKVGEEIMHNSE